MTRSETLRSFFAGYVTARAQAKDLRIRRAFAAVPQEHYICPGPWTIHVPGHGAISTPNDDLAFLYQDTLLAIDVERGINIGEPSLHARCLDAVQIREGETVLHVGAGVGYYTALLAHLVGFSGRCMRSRSRQTSPVGQPATPRMSLGRCAGEIGLAADLPGADVIYVNAGLPNLPRAWLDALGVHGRLIFPFQPIGGVGGMLVVERP